MSENQETIADIIDEIRRLSNPISDGIIAINGNVLTSRLEEAWKCEAKAIATETAVLPAVCITKTSGNLEAMREALKAMNDLFEKGVICTSYTNTSEEMDQIDELYLKAKAALSVSPRNCDRFNSVKDAALAFAREKRDIPHPCPDFTFSTWLFATSTERKGECE